MKDEQSREAPGPTIDWRKYATDYEREFSRWIGDGQKVYNLGDCAVIIWHNIIKPLRDEVERLKSLPTRAGIERAIEICKAQKSEYVADYSDRVQNTPRANELCQKIEAANEIIAVLKAEREKL